MAFHWRWFDGLPVEVRAVAWDWGCDARFEALAARGASAEALREDSERRAFATGGRRRRKARALSFTRFVPGRF